MINVDHKNNNNIGSSVWPKNALWISHIDIGIPKSVNIGKIKKEIYFFTKPRYV
jgi:hypothetical protein